MKDTCIFCKIVKKEIPAKIAYEDNKVMAFEDIHPQAPVHLIIIPKAHVGKLSELNDESVHIVNKLVSVANTLADERQIKDSGYRIVINCGGDAGQEVFHLHMHLLGGRHMNWPPG